jgi:hypothetical protein
MNKLVRLFNELIQHKIAHYYGDILLDCKLIERGYVYGYDLLFVFNREYNNPRIQLQSVLETCDMLFDWVDLRDMGGLSIVIITAGRNRHYSYFELMDEISKDGGYHLVQHPKYRQYMEWKSTREREERMKRAWEKETFMKERNTYNQESRKKKFLFW